MTLGLGLGILFLSLYQGYAEQAYSILFGTIVGISRLDVLVSAIFSVLVFVTLLVIFRPLLFSSLDPEVAEARGVPARSLSVVFMLLLAITISEAVQVVGVLLVFALLVAPAAAAERLTKRPFASILLAVFLGLLFTWAGLLLTFLTRWPASFYIAAFAALSYLSAVVFDRVHSPRRYKEPPHPSRECIDSSHIPHHA